jgi:hypothetical protein
LGFIKQVIQHYNTVSWRAQIGYIRFGIGTGGGGSIPCPSEELGSSPSTPLTLAIWGALTQNIFSFAATQSPQMVTESSGYGGENSTITTAWADTIAQNSIPYGAGFGAESLALNDAVLYSEGLPCSNDWCAIFNSYYSKTPMLGLQTIASLSDPTCTSNPGAGQTCSLVYVLPFGTQRRANVFEIGYGDLLCAFYSGGYSGCSSGSPAPGYAAAISNAEQGLPSSTTTLVGPARLSGKAAIE